MKTILDLAADYGCLLVQEANGWYKTNCPRHDDTRPSLRIAPEGDKWICFPCKHGGDIVAFAQWFNKEYSQDEAILDSGYNDIVYSLTQQDNYNDDERGATLLMQMLRNKLLSAEEVDRILSSEYPTQLLEGVLQ